jgi:hypothetical protein
MLRDAPENIPISISTQNNLAFANFLETKRDHLAERAGRAGYRQFRHWH